MFCGSIAILKTWHLHVKRYEIVSLTEVYYSVTSCHGSGHVMDPTIILFTFSDHFTKLSESSGNFCLT